MVTWAAQSLQCAAFHGLETEADAYTLWVKTFGRAPEQTRQAPPPAIGSSANGMVGEYSVSLNVAPGRQDLILSPRADIDATLGAPVISDVATAMLILRSYAERLLANVDVVRIGIVANLVEVTGDALSADQALRALLPLPGLPESASDLSFQMNVRSHVGQLQAPTNRLCRWQTTSFQSFKFTMGPEGVPTMVAPRTDFAVSLMIDVNNVPFETGVPHSATVTLLNDLAEEVLAIKLGGYARLSAA